MNAGENKESRAGRYVQQPAGYRAFIPAPLPPQPSVDLSGPLRKLLSTADYALGRLDGAVLTLPNPELFVYMYVRKEAVLSSQIEGTQSSLQNLLAAEARLNDPEAPADVAEVINYVRAMNHGLASVTAPSTTSVCRPCATPATGKGGSPSSCTVWPKSAAKLRKRPPRSCACARNIVCESQTGSAARGDE